MQAAGLDGLEFAAYGHYSALIARQPPLQWRNPEGGFDLIRIGDAIFSRNVHAAIYDALRYCSLL